MERVFLINSPRITKVEIERKGKVKRSKLYYLRGESGKKVRVKEQLFKKEKKAAKEITQEPETKEEVLTEEKSTTPVEEKKTKTEEKKETKTEKKKPKAKKPKDKKEKPEEEK